MMKRADWPERLAEFIAARRDTPFAWGANDCALFAFDAVAAMTGVDLIPAHRGAWHDARSAAAHEAAIGGLPSAVSALLPQIPPAFSGRGDVVLLRHDGRDSLGIHLGDRCAFTGHDGLLFLPPSAILAAWSA